jgi:UDP-N-acetylglucosamine--N-acetylmuramyl-(pentapeptide) pyrophosphoryl-undecaprenol N-acetylglucosamine transferase
VVLAGGGTGGHIFPALAMAEELSAAEPGCDLLFVGAAGGLEAQLVPEAGRRLELLSSVKAQGLTGLAKLPLTLPRAVWQARRLLGSFRPDVVVTLGGYAALAPGIAARAAGVPLVVLEQNAIPGRVSRFLARFAREVHVEFPESAGLFPDSQRVAATGNPVRRAILEAAARRAARPAESRGVANLLVIGGSLGARRLNELFGEAGAHLAALAGSLRVVHLAGTDKFAEAAERAAASPVHTQVLSFEKDMARLYAEADLVRARAGATALAEISACGIPAVLVPYPYAKDNHQEANARCFERAGAARVLLEKGLSGRGLAEVLAELLGSASKLAEMGPRMKSLGRPEAGPVIARRVLEMAAGKRG